MREPSLTMSAQREPTRSKNDRGIVKGLASRNRDSARCDTVFSVVGYLHYHERPAQSGSGYF